MEKRALLLVCLQHHSRHINRKPCFITLTQLTEQYSSLSCDELLSHGTDMWEWYFSKHVLHLPLPCCSSAHLLRKALSELRLFVLASPDFSPNTIVQRLPRLEMHWAIWEWGARMRDAANVLTGTPFFCSVQQYMSNVLGSQPGDFASFLCGTVQGMNTKHLLWSCRDNSIWFYPGFSQRQADISLLFVLSGVVNVCRLALGAEWEGDGSQTMLWCFLKLHSLST